MARRTTKNRTGNKSPRNYDYQAVHRQAAQAVVGVTHDAHMYFVADGGMLAGLSEEGQNLAVVGLYLRTTHPQAARLSLHADNIEIGAKSFSIGRAWLRVGLIFQLDTLPRQLVGRLDFSGELEFFGANSGIIDPNVFNFVGAWQNIRALQQSKGTDYPWLRFLEDLNSSHLAPEAGYLRHDAPTCCTIQFSDSLSSQEGGAIELKYCSLCERLLPISLASPGSLAFHRHTPTTAGGFRSWHQQECRACKKFKINDSLNQRRTSEQFHESSLIHRERSLFLKEPEILQRFKLQYGIGLKQFIWQKFDQKCFRCNTPLDLGEARIDHTRPFAYLWPLDEHATLLCERCNGEKSDTFPVNFYTEQDLARLASITGISIENLQVRGVNPAALQDVLEQITVYSNEWSAKTFKNVNLKIREFYPDLDLYQFYQRVTGHPYTKKELEEGEDDEADLLDAPISEAS
jgi:hypothetical protein